MSGSTPATLRAHTIRPSGQMRLARADAILVTHAHEDHIGGLGWCVANGFHGRIFMTRETRGDMDACLAEYATPEDRARAAQLKIEFFEPGGASPVRPGADRNRTIWPRGRRSLVPSRRERRPNSPLLRRCGTPQSRARHGSAAAVRCAPV